MAMIKAVLFDMDGVLIDSEPIYMHQTIDFFQHHGINVDHSELLKLPGSSHQLGLEIQASWWHETIAPEKLDELLELYYRDQSLTYSEFLNPHVKYMLPRLKQAGLQLAVASSSSLEAVNEMVEGCAIKEYFDFLISGQDLHKSKPDPAIYLLAMEKLNVRPEECIVIEDSNYGIEAGKRAGAKVIALKDPRFYRDQSEGDYLVADLFEAHHLIMKIKDEANGE